MDTDGKVKYDALVRQGHDADRVVHSKFQDLVPKEILDEGDPSLNRPDQVKIFLHYLFFKDSWESKDFIKIFFLG